MLGATQRYAPTRLKPDGICHPVFYVLCSAGGRSFEQNLSEGVSNPVAPNEGQKSFQRGDGIKAGIVAAQELDPLATNVFHPPILPSRR